MVGSEPIFYIVISGFLVFLVAIAIFLYKRLSNSLSEKNYDYHTVQNLIPVPENDELFDKTPTTEEISSLIKDGATSYLGNCY